MEEKFPGNFPSISPHVLLPLDVVTSGCLYVHITAGFLQQLVKILTWGKVDGGGGDNRPFMSRVILIPLC